jgi:hypothetical protein
LGRRHVRCFDRSGAGLASGQRLVMISDRETGPSLAHKLLTKSATRRDTRRNCVSHCTHPDLQERHSTTRKETGFSRLIIPRSWVRAPPAPQVPTDRNPSRFAVANTLVCVEAGHPQGLNVLQPVPRPQRRSAAQGSAALTTTSGGARLRCRLGLGDLAGRSGPAGQQVQCVLRG